jgi:hypothetical protein
VGFIRSVGNSSSVTRYCYVDSGVNVGRYAYKLRQIDADGAQKDIGGAEIEIVAPLHFYLAQNWPNPFNPSTNIRFGVPERSRVRLQIFNVVGQQVAELVNQEMNPGYFEKVWSANVASGLYFYRIEAVSVENPNKQFVDVKKMLLLK